MDIPLLVFGVLAADDVDVSPLFPADALFLVLLVLLSLLMLL